MDSTAESLSTGSGSSEAHSDMLQKHSELLEQARALAERCNASAPVSQLPAEILHSIFFILAHMYDHMLPPTFAYYNSNKIPPSSDYTQEIRRVSQVSHAWRKMAIESPSLWNATLDCSMPVNWGRELMRRTGAMPLKVFVDTEGGRTHFLANYRRFVLNNVERVESLHFGLASPRALSELFFKRMNGKAIALKTLAFGAGDLLVPNPGIDIYDDYQEEDGIDDRFLSASTDDYYPLNLQSLHISGSIFPLDCPIYLSLTSLRVDSFYNKVVDGPAWCDLLVKLPNLHSLALFHCISKTQGRTYPSISLPGLRSFKISGSFASAGQLFIHLFKTEIPPLSAIEVRIGYAEPTEDPHNFDRFMDTLAKVLNQHARVANVKTLFQEVAADSVAVSDCDPESRTRDRPTTLEIGLRGPFPSGRPENIPTLQRLLTLDDMPKHANFTTKTSFHHQLLGILTAPFIKIPDLQIIHTTTFRHLQQSFQDWPVVDAEPAFPLCFLQVTEIEVLAMPWDQRPSIGFFKLFLQWRKSLDSPLPHLKFSRNTQPKAAAGYLYDALKSFETQIEFVKSQHEKFYALDSDDSMADLVTQDGMLWDVAWDE